MAFKSDSPHHTGSSGTMRWSPTHVLTTFPVENLKAIRCDHPVIHSLPTNMSRHLETARAVRDNARARGSLHVQAVENFLEKLAAKWRVQEINIVRGALIIHRARVTGNEADIRGAEFLSAGARVPA